jgi:hypothetical protein
VASPLLVMLMVRPSLLLLFLLLSILCWQVQL